ncbi:cobalamin adenosyltransferase [Anaerosporobacter faecicola]|uniref:cobalamin adenosyltransferase n=1 Tax=Anaerosporobacter faecicola TaxID=2718714 RepID=UPI001438B57D|nr:cobalamin adenosyltransferase [Anaerosporobacter faecicola]
MALLTENDIRKLFNEKVLMEKGEFFLEKDMILTPSAKTYLADKNIIIRTDHIEPTKMNTGKQTDVRITDERKMEPTKENVDEVYETLFGITMKEKPEHMTHLRGNLLVFKDHPRIALRGAIDFLEAQIILTQIIAGKEGATKLIDDLEEIIRFIRKLLRSEITGDPIVEFSLQGLSPADIREQSYHPSKYFGIRHFLPSYKQGEMVAHLNHLRTLTRKTELIAFRAFRSEDNRVDRVDIIRAFNRLSSLFWIMMFKYMTGKYKE